MLPYKHYAASEIEQVLQQQENPSAPPHECGAEESTLCRWNQEIPEKLNAVAASLESLAKTSRIYLVSPLQRVYNALNNALSAISIMVHPPPDQSRLAWAFFVSQSHPVHLG